MQHQQIFGDSHIGQICVFISCITFIRTYIVDKHIQIDKTKTEMLPDVLTSLFNRLGLTLMWGLISKHCIRPVCQQNAFRDKNCKCCFSIAKPPYQRFLFDSQFNIIKNNIQVEPLKVIFMWFWYQSEFIFSNLLTCASTICCNSTLIPTYHHLCVCIMWFSVYLCICLNHSFDWSSTNHVILL